MRSVAVFLILLLNWTFFNADVTLKSPRVTTWGIWQNMAKCPANTYATGIQIKYEVYQGYGDDPGLNDVVFYCQPLNRTASPTNVWITGGNGPKGTWQPVQWCPQGQVIVGFALRSEPDYGDTADNFAAVNFAAYCGYPFGPRNNYNRLQSKTILYGTWSGDQFCPNGDVACGIQSQIQPTHSGDNTALNNVNVACCNIPNNGEASLSPPTDSVLLMSPRVTNRGRWYNMARCPKDHYATGMQTQYEDYQGNGDDSGLNDVAFYCQPLNDPTVPKDKSISGGKGPYGKWQAVHWCPQNTTIVGFALRSEKWYGNTADDFAAINFAAYCGTQWGVRTNASSIQGYSIDYGVWTQDQFCPEGHFACGIQSQIDEPQGIEGDDTALNNVNVDCCRVPLVCTPSYEWKILKEVDNSAGTSEQIPVFEERYRMLHDQDGVVSRGAIGDQIAEKIEETFVIPIANAITDPDDQLTKDILQIKIRAYSKLQGSNWVSARIPPGKHLAVKQLWIICGEYQVQITNTIKVEM